MLRPVSDEIRLHANAIQETSLVVGSTGMRVERAFLSTSWHELAGSVKNSLFLSVRSNVSLPCGGIW